jgi:tetratricopeptide (TPR) repeat protein
MTGAPQPPESETPTLAAQAPGQRAPLAAVQRWMAGMMVVVLLAWPVARLLAGRGGGLPAAEPSPAATPVVPAADSAAGQLALALQHYTAGRFQDCVYAAAEALRLQPGLAAAYNDMGACYGSMGKYDEEIAALRKALELQPDFPLAQNNLAWALDQKKSASR